jgi:hypothetical protein
MLLTHLYAVAGAGALLTAAWLFKPDERTQVTTLGAFFAWSLVGLLGANAEVATAGELITAPLPPEFRYFAALWALLSALALILHVWGVYPPQDSGEEIRQ